MEDTLKRLLTAEVEAERLVAQALTEREQLIQNALQEVQLTEQEFKTKIPQIHASSLERAETRATQSIAELSKRYQQKKEHLHQLAEENQQRALEAAIQVLFQVGKG